MTPLDQIKERIRARYGLTPRPEWDAALGRGLPSDVPPPLDGGALLALAGRVTIEESHFLRHPEQLEAAADWLVARLHGDAPGGVQRVWSAGCCRGEEPYSIVMAVLERLPSITPARLDVLGTDLSGESIRAARRGAFGEWSMRGVPPSIRDRYFERRAGDLVDLRPEVRRFVRFENLSIQEQLLAFGPGSIDLIFYRNVSVYMDPAAAAAVYENMARALDEDGALVISATDPRPDPSLFVPVNRDQPCILRRALGAEARLSRIPGPRRRKGERERPPRRSSLPPRPQPSVDALVRDAVRLGDRGHLGAALEIADDVVAAHPREKAGYGLRGRLRAAAHAQREAAADFERVLAIDPEDHVARFWYAESLRGSGDPWRSAEALRELERRLAALADDRVVDGEGDVTVGDLRLAARSMLEAME